MLLAINATCYHCCLLSMLLAITATCDDCYLRWLLPAMIATCYHCWLLSLLPVITAACYQCYLFTYFCIEVFLFVTQLFFNFFRWCYNIKVYKIGLIVNLTYFLHLIRNFKWCDVISGPFLEKKSDSVGFISTAVCSTSSKTRVNLVDMACNIVCFIFILVLYCHCISLLYRYILYS